VLRILIVWLYNNTDRSVLAAIVVHTMDTVSYSLFPNNGSHYDPVIVAPIAAIAAAIVTLLWGSRTLARLRSAAERGAAQALAVSGGSSGTSGQRMTSSPVSARTTAR
jgi:hypothetical protein